MDTQQKLLELIQEVNNIECIKCTKNEADFIFNKFPPEGDPTGMNFSKTYKFFSKGLIFKNYYILTMITGETHYNSFYRGVTEWCDHILKFKNKKDCIKYIDYIELRIKKQNLQRTTIER